MQKVNNEKGLQKPFFSTLLEQQLQQAATQQVNGGANPTGGYWTRPGSWDCILNQP